MGFSGASVIKNPAASEGDMDSIPGLGRSLEEGQPIPVFLLGISHGQRSLAGYSSWGSKRARHNWVSTHTHDLTWAGLPELWNLKRNPETWVIGAELVNGSVLETEDTGCSSTNSCSCLDSTLPLTFYQLPRWLSGNEYPCHCRRHKRYQFHPWVGKIPRRRAWQLTPVFFLGESYGQKSLVGCSPKSRKESDMTESTAHWLFTRLLSLLTESSHPETLINTFISNPSSL